jgi:hypothetical protein
MVGGFDTYGLKLIRTGKAGMAENELMVARRKDARMQGMSSAVRFKTLISGRLLLAYSWGVAC